MKIVFCLDNFLNCLHLSEHISAHELKTRFVPSLFKHWWDLAWKELSRVSMKWFRNWLCREWSYFIIWTLLLFFKRQKIDNSFLKAQGRWVRQFWELQTLRYITVRSNEIYFEITHFYEVYVCLGILIGLIVYFRNIFLLIEFFVFHTVSKLLLSSRSITMYVYGNRFKLSHKKLWWKHNWF